MSDGEVLGPRVQVAKAGTADSGGGQLALDAGMLTIRGRLHSRALGSVAALDSVRFTDMAGKQATLKFQDGTAWEVSAEEPGLLEFARAAELQTGRLGVVTEPPRVSQRVKQAMTPNTTRRAIEVLCALALGGVARWAVSHGAGLGYALMGLSVFWLALLGIAVAREGAEGMLASIRELLPKLGWALTIVLPLALLGGAMMGVGDAMGREMREADARDEVAQQQAQAQAQAREAVAAKAQSEQVSAQATHELQAALNAQRWQQAREALVRLRNIDPEHPSIPSAVKLLAPKLAEANEAQRQKALTAALRRTPRIVADPMRCDNVNQVAEAWKGLGAARADDPGWEQALKLTPKLERCRQAVGRSLARSTAESGHQRRLGHATQLQTELRRAGLDVVVETQGRRARILGIEVRPYDKASVARISGGAGSEEGSFLGKRQAEGFAEVRITDGKKRSRRFKLKPRSDTSMSREVLARFGLDQRLALEAPENNAQPEAELPPEP